MLSQHPFIFVQTSGPDCKRGMAICLQSCQRRGGRRPSAAETQRRHLRRPDPGQLGRNCALQLHFAAAAAIAKSSKCPPSGSLPRRQTGWCVLRAPCLLMCEWLALRGGGKVAGNGSCWLYVSGLELTLLLSLFLVWWQLAEVKGASPLCLCDYNAVGGAPPQLHHQPQHIRQGCDASCHQQLAFLPPIACLLASCNCLAPNSSYCCTPTTGCFLSLMRRCLKATAPMLLPANTNGW